MTIETPRAAASPQRTLHIGGSGLPWAGAATLGWFGSYDLIYCEPGKDSEAEQSSFIQALRTGLGMLHRWNGRVVWIVNEYFSAKIAGEIGAGELVPLPALPEGRILTFLGDITGRASPLSAFRDLPHGWTTFATWTDRARTAAVTVGTMSGDERWIVAPRGMEPRDFLVPHEDLQRYLPVAWILFLVLATLFLGRREYRRVQEQYDADVARVATVDVPGIIAEREIGSDDAAGRMLRRVLSEHSKELTSIATELRFAQTPTQLLETSGSDYRGRAHFLLALASGDLDGAYRAAEAAMTRADDESKWARLLTDTLWQRAVESLLELDFQHSEPYAAMFLELSNRQARSAKDREGVQPERNRTLARILLRELRSPRIYSLCGDPEKAREFGRLLGGDWGEALPETTPALIQARRRNASEQCRGKQSQPFDYAVLETLEKIDSRTDLAALPVCGIAPAECAFLKHRAALLEYDKALSSGNTTPSPIPAALQFAADCSYLSDDLLTTVTTIATDDAVKSGLRVDFPALDAALVCVGEDSDHRLIIGNNLEQLPCDALEGQLTAARAPLSAALLNRCRP